MSQHGLEPRRRPCALAIQDRPARETSAADRSTPRRRQAGAGEYADEARGRRAGREQRPDERDRDAELAARLAERTADLQRLKAEYDNYRKRIHRDQLAIREVAVVNVLRNLLPVLDIIEQAREHAELTSALGMVADTLGDQLAGLGLEAVGTPGEAFDPTRHEALVQEISTEVTQPTCTAVLRRGYRVGEHLLRPADVTVAEPAAPGPEV